MVRVSPQHLGRAAMCPIAGCGGGLRIESVDGYPVDICVKCERRLQVWTTLQAQLKAALAKADAQEKRAKQAEVANIELLHAIDAARAAEPPAPMRVLRKGPSVTAQILAALQASGRALETKELRKHLPDVLSSRVGPALNYLVLRKHVRRTKLPWGLRSKYKYTAVKRPAVAHG